MPRQQSPRSQTEKSGIASWRVYAPRLEFNHPKASVRTHGPNVMLRPNRRSEAHGAYRQVYLHRLRTDKATIRLLLRSGRQKLQRQTSLPARASQNFWSFEPLLEIQRPARWIGTISRYQNSRTCCIFWDSPNHVNRAACIVLQYQNTWSFRSQRIIFDQI